MFVAKSNKKSKRKNPAKPCKLSPPGPREADAIATSGHYSPPPSYDQIYPQNQSAPRHPQPHPPGSVAFSPSSRTAPCRKQATTQDSVVNQLTTGVSTLALQSVPSFRNEVDSWHGVNTQRAAHGALCQLISSKFDAVITSIDGENFTGSEQDLEIREDTNSGIRGGWGSTSREVSRGANKAISSAVISTNYFAKANLYANSRLPPNLPPLKLYLPSYPLLCLAAQYSQRAYVKPTGREREAFVNADWRLGTKAMMIKSIPIDDMNCIVFAIRGSQTFMDWAVNLNSAPVAPIDFLDDPGNLCHSGFLSVARKMIKPVAARLRSLLEEDPSRSTCSLLMTGHSAGGAVASLLYAHMLAEEARSELNILTGCFKRIHCLTFGTPPISLLPLSKPTTLRCKKSLFISFINEGDPVPRADKAYIRSLLNLYASPAPGSTCQVSIPKLKPCKRKNPSNQPNALAFTQAPNYIWRVPPGTLSNAGRLVVLRDTPDGGEQQAEDVKAEITSDEQLRGVVFGDPVMHMMKVYARRVEVLATKAVTAKIWG